MFEYLIPVGGTVLEELGGVALLEEACPWEWALRSPKIPAIPRVFFATYGSGSELSAAVPCFPPRWSWTPIPLEP